MDLFLLSMPMGDMTQPYTALPALAGHLRPLGYEVGQKDYGIEFAHFWSEPSRLCRLWDLLEAAMLRHERLGVSAADWEDYVDLKLLAGRIGPHIPACRTLLLQLQSKDVICDLGLLSERLRLLTTFQSLLDFVERQSNPMGASFQALCREQALRMIEHPAPSHREFIDEVLGPDLMKLNPRMVGVSVTYPKQLYASLLACAAVRLYLPRTKVVLGGAYLSTVVETMFDPSLRSLWDYVVDGEGETALGMLLAAGNDPTRVTQVPNLVYQAAECVHRSAYRHEEDLHALNTPDYAGLNIERYLAPDPVFLLPVARGCYMRCTFCSISYATRKYRTRTGEQIVRDIENVQAQFGRDRARYFNFSIDVMAPKHLKELALALEHAKLQVVWDAEIRFDNTLSRDIIASMRRAGCRHIRFGLESAVDRIRALMDKRIRMDRVNQILEDCREEDIKTSAMVIIGFPGETEPEARQTFQFLFDNHQKLRFYTLHVYTVSRGSIIAAHPEKFAVDLTMRNDRLVQPSWDFKISQGIPTARAWQLVGEFRSRLMERYPLASEGFSVGIGGAFTFLVTATWSWNDLSTLDRLAVAGEQPRPITRHSVPSMMPRIETFTSPLSDPGSTSFGSAEHTLYLATPAHSLLKLEGPAKAVVGHIDGVRSVTDIATAVFRDEREDTLRELTEFLVTLRDSGAVRFFAPGQPTPVGT
jgi:anaerobic magnesium-protoporphyrin IX monomethyl ester cyclase